MSKHLAKWPLILCFMNSIGAAHPTASPIVPADGNLSRVCVAGSDSDAKTRARAILAQRLADEKRQAIYGHERMERKDLNTRFAVINANYIEADKFQYFELSKDNKIFSCVEISK